MARPSGDGSEQVAGRDLIAHVDSGAEVPQAGAVEPGRVAPRGCSSLPRAEGLQRALGAVEDAPSNPGPSSTYSGPPVATRLVGSETRGVLEGLHHHQLAVDPDDLHRASVHADPGHVEQAGVGQIRGGRPPGRRS